MTQEGGTPPDFWGRIQKMIDDAVAKLARSGMLRNASISDGGLTIKGGFLALISGLVNLFYVGPVTPAFPDGTLQQGMILRREDGTTAMALYDPFPDPTTPGGFKQFLAIYDRQGNIIISDDTESGQGIARPYLSGGFRRARQTDWGITTTSATFETLWQQYVYKQHPNLTVGLVATMDTAGTTGEIRVMVDGVQLDTVRSAEFLVASQYFTGPVAGSHMQIMDVQIQGRRTSASGALRIEPQYWLGRRS